MRLVNPLQRYRKNPTYANICGIFLLFFHFCNLTCVGTTGVLTITIGKDQRVGCDGAYQSIDDIATKRIANTNVLCLQFVYPFSLALPVISRGEFLAAFGQGQSMELCGQWVMADFLL